MMVFILPQEKYSTSWTQSLPITGHLPRKETAFLCQECTFLFCGKFSCKEPSVLSMYDVLIFYFVYTCMCVLAFTFYRSSGVEPTNNVYTDGGTLKSLLTVTTWLWCCLHRLKLWSLVRFNYLTLLKSYICREEHTCMEGQKLWWEKEKKNQERQ